MANLYSNLPPRTYSLRDFNHQATRFNDSDDKTGLLRFVLTGQVFDEVSPHQAVVDPLRGHSIWEDQEIKVSRNYDSILGIASNIVVQSDISIYPVSNPADALTTSIHLKYGIERDNVSQDHIFFIQSLTNSMQTTIYTPYHRIPNLQLGIFGVRHSLHAFLPLLLTEEREKGSYLSMNERKTFYEKGLRPAIEELLPGNVSEWPATVDNEMFRAKKHSGALAYQTKMIPSYAVPFLAQCIRDNLYQNNVSWGEGLFILHTIRGTKHCSQHSQNEEAARRALEEHCEQAGIPLDADQREGQWWIDIGLEFSV